MPSHKNYDDDSAWTAFLAESGLQAAGIKVEGLKNLLAERFVSKETIRAVLNSLVEPLACIEHQRWAHWQKYQHGKCRPCMTEAGALVIPSELVRQWEKQIAAPYENLSEAEKESDREQVRRYLPLIARALLAASE